MTALARSPFSLFTWTRQMPEPKVDDTHPYDDTERREIVGDMIATGACDSEHGVQMLMSVFPDQF